MDEESCNQSHIPFGSSVLRSSESSSSTSQRSEAATSSGGSNSQAQKLQTALILGLETAIKDPKETYNDKFQALLTAWTHVSIYLRLCPGEEKITSVIEWIYGHTLKLIFQGDWPSLCKAMVTHLIMTVQKCRLAVPSSSSCDFRLKTLLNLVRSPWGHDFLVRLFNRPNGFSSVTDEEIIAFCDEDTLTTLVIRLETLSSKDCEDLALRLARVCSRYVQLKGLKDDASAASHLTYILDVQVALLFWKDKKKSIMTLLSSLELGDGAALVKRFADDRMFEEQVIWKNSVGIAQLCADFFLAAAMMKSYLETEALLLDMMNLWTRLQDDSGSKAVPDMVRKLINQAQSAEHIYAFCRVLLSKYGAEMKTLCIELYIQGLTSDMNELEQQKTKKDAAKVSDAEYRLSNGFLELGELVQDNLGVCRECVLTAFSIHPTYSCYAKLKELANAQPDAPANVDTGQNKGIKTNLPKAGIKRCALHPPFDVDSGLPPGELCYTCGSFTGIDPNPEGKKIRTLGALIKGDTMTKSRNYDVFSAPSIVLDADSMGLTRQVLDDLTVVLSCPRYLPLSWAFDWSELSATCEKYLENSDNRNKDTELKYLNIDYDQFKDWPRNCDGTDDSSGIEKGYEDFIEWPEDDDEEEEEEEEEKKKVIRSVSTKAYKRLMAVDGESDSSVEHKRRSRSVKPVRRLDIESDNDSGSGFKKQYPSSMSGYDTCTQDSITDSLGSDGFRIDKPKATKKNAGKQTNKKKIKETYSTVTTEKLSRRDVSREGTGNKVMSVFKVDENGEKISNSHGARVSATNGKLLDKRVSDPNVVKSLRMFRHQNSKKKVPTPVDNKSQSSYTPVTNTNLIPRVVLHRTEDLNQQTSPKKPLTPNNLQTEAGLMSRKVSNSKSSFQLTSKNGIAFDETMSSVQQSVLECEMIKAGVPGLNSLEMLVPPISEATVQVVQLPRNPPAPSGGNNTSSILRTQTPKVTSTSQNTVSSGAGTDAASSSSWTPSSSQGVVPVTSSASISGSENNTQSTPVVSASTLTETQTGSGHSSTRKVDAQPVSESEPFRLSQTMTLASLLQSRPDIAQLATNRDAPRVVRVLNAVHASTLLEANLASNSLSDITRPIQTVFLGTQRRSFGESEVSRSENSSMITLNEQLKESSGASTSTSKVATKTTATSLPITAHIQKVGQPPTVDAGLKPVNLSITHSEPTHFVRAATVTSSDVQMPPAQYVLMQTGERSQSFTTPTERQQESLSPSEGLPKFHHAFSNKASRSIYCQTNPSETSQQANTSEETESNPVTQPSAFQAVTTATPTPPIPTATQTQSKPVQTKPSGNVIHSGMLQTLLASQAITKENFMMTSRGPILRIFRTPSRQSPSMVYIGTANAKPSQINNVTSAHVTQPSMKILRLTDLTAQPGSSSTDRQVVPTVVPPKQTKDTATTERSVNRSKFHGSVASSMSVTTPVVSQEPQVCILDSSSDEEIDVSHPALQNTVLKSDDVQTSGVAQLQTTDMRQNRLNNFTTPLQTYPSAAATKDLEQDNVEQSPLKLPGTVSSTPTEPASSLEQQLLEFDVVLKQFTETSKMKEKGEIQSEGTLPGAQSSITINTGSSEYPATHIPCLKVPTVSRMLPVPAGVSLPSSAVVKTPPKVTKVVMVSSNCQAVVSPSVSISSNASSPCISTSSSAGKTSPSKSPKSSKAKTIKTSPSTSTGGSKASPIPKPQQKPQEDEQTAQRIYAILDDYAEQIRNSPDLNNKPAPRRRSNPPTNPSQNSKRKKSSHSKVKLLGQQSSSSATEMSPGVDDPSLLGSEDSCSNLMSMSQIQDSPAVSQAGDDTTTIDSSSEGGNLKSVVTESGDTPEPRHTLLCGVQGMLFKDSSQGVGDKPVLSAAGFYVPGNVRQMLMQGLKGHKVIRVQQVSVPGAPGSSGIPAATLVLRQMISPSATASVFSPQQQQQTQPLQAQQQLSQTKLPIGTISSQSFTGVSAQSPVVVPIGSHPLMTSDTSVLCARSPVTDAPINFHPLCSESESVVTSTSNRDEPAPSPRLLSVMSQSPITLGTEPALSLQSSPSSVRRCVALNFTSQTSVPVITNSHFQLTENSESDMQVEVPERSGFTLGGEAISMGGSIQMTPSTSTEHVDQGSPSESHLIHAQPRNQSEALFQTVNSNTATVTRMTKQVFPKECGGLLEKSSQSTATSANDVPVTTETVLQVSAKPLPSQLAQNSPNSQETTSISDVDRQFLKRKAEPENDDGYPKRKFPNRWGESLSSEDNVRLPNEQVKNLTSAATLEKTDEISMSKQHELELLAQEWSDGNCSEDSTPLNQQPMKSLLKNRLLMKSLKSSPKADSLLPEQKVSVDSFENKEDFDEKDDDKQLKRKGKWIQKKESESTEAKNADHVNLIQQCPLTDNASTPEIVSAKNFTDSFDQQHKPKSGQQRQTKTNEQSELCHLLIPYNKKQESQNKVLNSNFDTSRTEGIMMMGSEIIPASQLTDSTSEVEEPTIVRPQQFLTDKLESEGKKIGRRPRHSFTEVLLQKSLSEECEDLGVDRPSTSELFPEADLLLDTNSSPGFDASLQDASCSQSVVEPMFAEFSLPPTCYSSTSEDGNSNDSKSKASSKSKVDSKKISTRSVRSSMSTEKSISSSIINKPLTRRATKSNRSKKAKLPSVLDVNGSSKHKTSHAVESVNESKAVSRIGEQDSPVMSTTERTGSCTVNGSSFPTDSDRNTAHKSSCALYKDVLAKESKIASESRLTGTKTMKSVADNEYSNTDASPGDSMFSTESSSEDGNLLREKYGPNCVDSSEPTISSPLASIEEEYEQTNSPQAEGCLQLPLHTSSDSYRNRSSHRSYINKRRRHPSAEEFHDHNIDSEETWESTSSQDKTGADDEDSGSRSRTEMSSEVEPDQSSQPFPPESYTFKGKVNTQCIEKTSGANGLDVAINDTIEKSIAKKLAQQLPTKPNKVRFSSRQNILLKQFKVEPTDSKRSSKRIKKLMSRRRCRSLEPQCVLLDVVDLTREGTKVRHLRHSALRGPTKKPCACCNGTEDQAKKKEDVEKVVPPTKKIVPNKQVVKGNNTKKR